MDIPRPPEKLHPAGLTGIWGWSLSGNASNEREKGVSRKAVFAAARVYTAVMGRKISAPVEGKGFRAPYWEDPEILIQAGK